jgi:taurine dioxygenase
MSGGIVGRLDWERRGTLREALREHPLIVFSAPGLREEDLLALAAALGEIVPPNLKKHALPGHPELMAIGNVRDEASALRAGSALDRGWHTDMSYTPNPPELTLLYGVTLPREGGDTHFSSLYGLFDRLDAPTRERWADLAAEHVYRSPRPGEPAQSTVHPLIRVHPESGRSLVYASPGYAARVIDVPAAESEAIVCRLAASFDTPDYVHRWQPGDLLAWDNRAVVHRATPHDPDEVRLCWRAMIRLRTLSA